MGRFTGGLLTGFVVGLGTALLVPKDSRWIRPAAKAAIRAALAAYESGRVALAEFSETADDLIAEAMDEVRARDGSGTGGLTPDAAAPSTVPSNGSNGDVPIAVKSE